MLAPLAGRSFVRLVASSEHGAARPVVDIAQQPVASLAFVVGGRVAAHSLGLTREAACPFESAAPHQAASRSQMRSIG